MKKLNVLFLMIFASLFVITGCDDDDGDDKPTTANFELNISGLEDLGSNYTYENWIVKDGKAYSAGTFNVNANKELSKTSFTVDAEILANASDYVLTIEPNPDPNAGPSDVHILGGSFSGNSAIVSVSHAAAIGNDFTSSTGKYILATPTNDNEDDEHSGVWWVDPSGPAASLDLPALPAGWLYEGWAVIDGKPVSTGRFSTVSGADDFKGFSGTAKDGPPFPGEDFLMNAPTGVTFPTDLSGGTVVISVEPNPDNSDAPFLLKPLVGMVPSDANVHTLYGMTNNASATNPTGKVTR